MKSEPPEPHVVEMQLSSRGVLPPDAMRLIYRHFTYNNISYCRMRPEQRHEGIDLYAYFKRTGDSEISWHKFDTEIYRVHNVDLPEVVVVACGIWANSAYTETPI